MKRPPSLKARLTLGPLILQFLAVAVAALALVLFFVNSKLDGMYAEEAIVKVAASAIARDEGGRAVVILTPALAELCQEAPDLWFSARLADGDTVAYGNVPPELASLVASLDKVSAADVRGHFAPFTLSAVVRRTSGPAGEMTIIAHGKVQPFTVLITMASNVMAIVVLLVLTLVSVIANPMIVRRALAGVVKTAQEAERIDAGRGGVRLPEDQVPSEIAPLVRAVNAALGRLDEGYERQQRFIASAAHELRTPIAIVRMKIDASTHPEVRALSLDVSRLANLSEQLLDLHRLESGAPGERINLAAVARSVAADLAPVVIAAGKTIEVIVDRPGVTVMGHAGSIERVLINLIQNAVEHGGDAVVVRIDGTAFEVLDNGAGIPAEQRERVFEPFHRLRPRSTGAGLGLSLVRQVVDHHGGRVAVLDREGAGAVIRVELPAAR